jgi:hypothetical protein
MAQFTKTILFTDTDGRAKFREESVALTEGTPQAALSPLDAFRGLPVAAQSRWAFAAPSIAPAVRSGCSCSRGRMEIGLQDGSSRRVSDRGNTSIRPIRLPEGATFDATIHGHWSRQVGPEPLITLFVRG